MLVSLIGIDNIAYVNNIWKSCHHSCALVAINILRPRQNGHHFPDDIFKCILMNGNVWILITISLTFVTKGQVNNIQVLVQAMAWHQIPIIWANADLIHWCIYAALGGDDLTSGLIISHNML